MLPEVTLVIGNVTKCKKYSERRITTFQFLFVDVGCFLAIHPSHGFLESMTEGQICTPHPRYRTKTFRHMMGRVRNVFYFFFSCSFCVKKRGCQLTGKLKKCPQVAKNKEYEWQALELFPEDIVPWKIVLLIMRLKLPAQKHSAVLG